jgi:hypothetical protein
MEIKKLPNTCHSRANLKLKELEADLGMCQHES